MTDISKVTDYLYVGFRVGKEQAECKLKPLNNIGGIEKSYGKENKKYSHHY